VDIDHVGEGPAGMQVVGSAASPPELETSAGGRQHARLPALLLHPLRTTTPEASFQPDSEDYLDALIKEDRRRIWRRRGTWLAALAVLLVGVAAAVLLGYRYTQTQYYVGFDGDQVAIYQGVQATIGPIRLSHVVEETGLSRGQISPLARELIDDTISAPTLDAAQRTVDNARENSSG
jgi:protein phosphatase